MKMKLPTREEAERLVKEAEEMNPGPWGDHSRVTAECAFKIAMECDNLDAECAYILGLLHDIGRRFGISHFKHIVDGYRFMQELGYDTAARICLTHSFHTKNIKTYIGNFDVPAADTDEMKDLLNNIVYDDYDKLIQLCDCLATAEGVVKIEDRLADVAKRYHAKEYPKEKEEAIFSIKNYFEEKAGKNIYEILSRVS